MSEAEIPTSSAASALAGQHLSLAQQLHEVTTMAIAVADASSSLAAVSGPSSSSEVVPSGIGTAVISRQLESAETEDTEPLKKKLKSDVGVDVVQEPVVEKEPVAEKLESRLGGILCCAVCLDLPKSVIYQCQNGHLMCAGCFTHLLADCRLRDESATCPNCRVEISKHAVSRNLAVEKAVSELPDVCQYCNKQFPRNSLDRHENDLCIERTKTCKFSRIGCPWRGPFHELKSHEASCFHPQKSGAEVMEVLATQDQKHDEDRKLNNIIFDLLSIEKITFNDLQLKPYRTDEFVHKLYYETSRFSAFNNQFVVKARITSQQRDPTHSCDRQIEYQLILKTKPTTATLDMSFVVLKGPFGDMKLNPKIHKFEFSEQNNESTHFQLPLVDSAECNRLLAAKTIHFRLIVFLQ